MRWVLILLAAAGCKDEKPVVHDMAMKMFDLTTAGCDVPTQNCGSGKKCVGMFDDMGNVLGTCVDNGTVAEGQPCLTMQDPSTYLDNCQAGLICDNTGPDAAYVCRKMCTDDSACTGGQRCANLFGGAATWGWCLPTCVAFSTATGNCPAGNDCSTSFYDIQNTMTNQIGFFICKKTGTTPIFGSCMVDTDCAAGLWCELNQSGTSGVCVDNCDPTHMCTMPAADAGVSTMCNLYVDQNAGYCYLM